VFRLNRNAFKKLRQKAPVTDKVAPYAAKNTARCDCWQQFGSRDTRDTSSDTRAPVKTQHNYNKSWRRRPQWGEL